MLPQEASLIRGTSGRYFTLCPKVRCINFPFVTLDKTQGTPLPLEEDHQEGDVDGDDVVGEPKLGYEAPHGSPLSGVLQEPLLGVEWDPLIRKGSVD